MPKQTARQQKILARARELVHLDRQGDVVERQVVVATLQHEFGLSHQTALAVIGKAARTQRIEQQRALGDLIEQDPETPEEWQAAVDMAHFYLCLDAARRYGLISGGPEIDVDRCEDILERGQARGVR